MPYTIEEEEEIEFIFDPDEYIHMSLSDEESDDPWDYYPY